MPDPHDWLLFALAALLGEFLRRRRRALRYASGTAYVSLGVATALVKRT